MLTNLRIQRVPNAAVFVVLHLAILVSALEGQAQIRLVDSIPSGHRFYDGFLYRVEVSVAGPDYFTLTIENLYHSDSAIDEKERCRH